MPNPQGDKLNEPINEMNNQLITEKISFDDISLAVDTFNSLVDSKYSTATLRIPQKGTIYSFSYIPFDASHARARNTIEFDLKTKVVSKHDKFEDKSLVQQLMGSIFALHTGEYFGIIGQIGMFLASLMMPLFAITGLLMYLKRSKKRAIIKE